MGAAMRDEVLCAADLPVRLQLGGRLVQVSMVMPARDWSDRLGIAWDTVRQRRYRGDSWSEAFQPYLRRTPFNNPTAAPVPERKKITISGAIQMATLEIKIPAIAHVVVTGVPDGVKAAVMREIQDMLQEKFGASATGELPGAPATPDEVKKSLWVLSEA